MSLVATSIIVATLSAMIGSHGEPAAASIRRLPSDSASQADFVPNCLCLRAGMNLELFEEVEDEKRGARIRDLRRTDLSHEWSICRSVSAFAVDCILAPAPLASLQSSGVRWQI